MTDETTTEQLAEIEGQTEPIQVREGRWRTRAGEIRSVTPTPEGDGRKERYPWWDAQWLGTWTADGRYHLGAESPLDLVEYLGPIEEQPQPQPIQVREGRWRTRHGAIRNVTPTPAHDSRAERWPWRDAKYDQTWREDGGCHIIGESPSDLVEYLGPIEQQPQPQPQQQPESQPEPHTATIEELRSEVSYVQRLLGESRQRATQLEELVASLRTINDAQEKAVRLAGQENTDLQHRLNVVSAEWAEQSETVRKLRIELDAAQQVPQAVSDRFEEGWDAGTARAVETIAEWTEPIRHLIDAADNMAETEQASNLAADIIRALPAIMRSLTGLTPED